MNSRIRRDPVGSRRALIPNELSKRSIWPTGVQKSKPNRSPDGARTAAAGENAKPLPGKSFRSDVFDKASKLAPLPITFPLLLSVPVLDTSHKQPAWPVRTNWTSNGTPAPLAFRDEGAEDSSAPVERVSPHDWIAAQRVVSNGNRDIVGAIKAAMQQSDVLVIGETHTDQNPVRRNAIDLINGAYHGGARTLYVELPDQAQLDLFLKTGNNTALPYPAGDQPTYVAMLREAHRLGMKIIAVDTAVASSGSGNDVRDATMARHIHETLPRNGKAVFWVGALHAVAAVQVGNTEVKHPFQSAASLLRIAGLSLTTVMGVGQDDALFDSTESKLRSRNPVLINTSDLPESIRKLDPRLPPGGTDSSWNSPLGSTPFTVPIGGVDLTLHH